MQTKALWTDQNCGMVYEKHNGLTLGKTKNNISTFLDVCHVHS